MNQQGGKLARQRSEDFAIAEPEQPLPKRLVRKTRFLDTRRHAVVQTLF